MATGNQRDVTLAVGIKTNGESALRNLATEVQNLAKRGGDAAPAYTQLANELNRLAQQASSLEAFKALSADVEQLTLDQRAAAEAASLLGEKLEQQRRITADAQAVEEAAQRALKETRTDLQAKRYELEKLNIETERAKKSDDVYLSTSNRLKLEILDLTVAVRGRREALRAAADAAGEAEKVENKLASQYERSAKAAGQVDTALNAQREAMTRAAAAAEQLGLSVADVAAAEEKLLAAQQRIVGGVAEARINAAREQAEADRLVIIEQQGLAELYERGRVALIAETTAIREAAAASKQYAAAQKELAAAAEAAERANRAEAAREQAEADRLAAIQAKALAELYDRGRAALLAETAAIHEAADATRRLAQAQAEASARAAEALNDAFGTTGVRSMQAVQAEVAKVGQALNLLQENYRSGAISAADFSRATSSAQVRLAQLRQEALNIPALPNVFERMNSSINDLIGKFGSLTAAFATVGFAVKPVLDANIQLETLRRTLTFVTGSAAEATKQIDFLREVAQRNGLAVGALADSFSLFSASMLKSGQSLETMQTLFSGVAGAAATLGISSERVSNILLALGQVANKGKVSLEELQGQIGEALPGAMKIAADSVGLTSDELRKMLESGQLLSKDFLPLFARALQTTFGEGTKPVKGLQQAFNDLRTAATITAQSLADTSLYRGLTTSIEALARNFDSLIGLLGSAAKAFAVFKALDMAREFLGIKAAAEAAAAGKAKDVAATTAAVAAERQATQARAAGTASVVAHTEALAANTLAKRANAAAAASSISAVEALGTGFTKVVGGVQAATSRIGSLIGLLGGPFGTALTLTIAFSEQLGGALASLAARWTGVTAEIEKNEAALRKQAAADRANIEAAQRAAEERSKSAIRQTADYVKVQEAAENAVRVAELELKAAKERGDASLRLAELAGNEAQALQVKQQVEAASAESSRKVLDAQRSLLSTMQAREAAIIRVAGGEDRLDSVQKAQLETLREAIKVQRAHVDQAREQAAASQAAAAAASQAAQAYGDQSGKLQKLNDEVKLAEQRVAELIYQQSIGMPVTEKLAAAQEELAKKLGLQRKAIEDMLLATERNLTLKRADAEITQANVAAELNRARTMERLAQLNGDEVGAMNARIQQRVIENRGIAEGNRLTREQADELIVALERQREQLRVTGLLNPELEYSINLRIKEAQARKAQATAGDEVVRANELEIESLRRLANARAAAAAASGAGTSRGAGNIDGSGMGAFNASVKGSSGMMAGQGGGAVDASYVFDLWARFQQGRVTAEELPAIRNALSVAENNARLGGPGSVSPEGRLNDQMWIGRLKQIINAIEILPTETNDSTGTGLSRSAPATTSAAAAPAAAPRSAASSPGAMSVVPIYIDGRSAGTVNVASDSIGTLQSVLTQLAQSQGRAA